MSVLDSQITKQTCIVLWYFNGVEVNNNTPVNINNDNITNDASYRNSNDNMRHIRSMANKKKMNKILDNKHKCSDGDEFVDK